MAATMKKLLLQLDTDAHPSTFDTIVAYDGGADAVIRCGGANLENVGGMVDGAIFTRGPKAKRNTAIFVGGSVMAEGEQLFNAVRDYFFADFRVSVMLDSNGSNTTAAAAVIRMLESAPAKGKRAVVLAGTGPVGQRAAAMLAKEGAQVALTSRHKEHAEQTCQRISERFGVEVEPIVAPTSKDRMKAIADAQLVLAAGAGGVELLEEEHWSKNSNIEVMADANASPPLGIAGTQLRDQGEPRHGKMIWGSIGFGSLKLALHRHCIGYLFHSNTEVFDAERIYTTGKELAATKKI